MDKNEPEQIIDMYAAMYKDKQHMGINSSKSCKDEKFPGLF